MEFLLEPYESRSVINDRVKNALRARPDNLYKKHDEYNLTKFISPYYVNPWQKQMLQDVIGKKNVSDIDMLNALVYSGILNIDCPPRGFPGYSEKYIDPVTGKVQCRTPMHGTRNDKRVKTAKALHKTGFNSCPKPGDSPFAFEAYVDDMGHPRCRVPAVRGMFNCAQPPITDGRSSFGQYDMTKSDTLADGTGVCLSPDTITSASAYPSSVVPGQHDDTFMLYGGTMYEKLNNYAHMFEDVNLNMDSIKNLNNVLKNSRYVSDFRSKIAKQPSLAALEPVIRNINTDDDLRIANTALYELLKTKHPEYVKKHNVTYGGFMGLRGGTKRRSKRRSKK